MDTKALEDRDVVSRLRTMRFGYTSGMYPPAEEVAAEDLPRWHLHRAAALGHTALQLHAVPEQKDKRFALRDEAAELGITLEGTVHSLFVPEGIDPSADNERSEEHTSELQSRGHLVCRLLLEKK